MMYVFNLIIFISLSLCSVLLSEEKGLSLEKNITSNPVFDTKKNIFGSGSLYGPLQPIIVSARKKQESQHSVPVNVFTIQQDQLESYNIQNLVDASEIVPNVNIHHGGAGNGSFLYIRGIGSSSISAAFDQSVALNIDGAVLNRGRFIHNSYLDTKQIEILKGPQALYFGKSATAGVISLFTNDPSSEKELSITTGLEPMHKGSFIELILSGPLTQTLGTRFAFGYSKQAEVWQNYAYKNNPSADLNGTQQWFGMESLDSRLTFVWNIKENLTSKFKYSFSHFVNNGGGTAWLETICPNGSSQATGIPINNAIINTLSR